MSTHGRTRRTWLSVEVFSERIYKDGRGSPPDHVLRLGPVMLAVVPRAGRWRRRLFDLEAWSLIAGREWRDGVTLYTPFAEFDVHFNDDTHTRWTESGDIPEEARRA